MADEGSGRLAADPSLAVGTGSAGGDATRSCVVSLGKDLDEESTLRILTENIRDQDDLEHQITFQASLALIDAEDKKDQRRIERAELKRAGLENQKTTQQQKLRGSSGNRALRLKIEREIAWLDTQIELCIRDVDDLNQRIQQRHQEGVADGLYPGAASQKRTDETERGYLIRTGKITPFAKVGGARPGGIESELADAIINAEDEALSQEVENEGGDEPRSHQNLRLPGFAEDFESARPVESEFSLRPRKKRRLGQISGPALSQDDSIQCAPVCNGAMPESAVSDDESDDSDLADMASTSGRRISSKSKGRGEERVNFNRIDDGDESSYQARLSDWVGRRSRARRRRREESGERPPDAAEDVDTQEWHNPCPGQPDHQFGNGLRIPGDIYPSLFDYQKTGVQWLAELYAKNVGGIIGDEMGLGKTGR